MLLCPVACRLPALCTLTIAHCSLALDMPAWPSPGTSAGGPGALCLLFMCLSQQSCIMELQPQLWLLAREVLRRWLGAAHASQVFMQHYSLSSTPIGRISAGTWETWSSLNVRQATKKVTLNPPLWEPWCLPQQCWATDRHPRALSPLASLYNMEKGPTK